MTGDKQICETPRTRRDELGDCIELLRKQIPDMQHELMVARRDRKDAQISEERMNRAAHRALDCEEELVELERDLADRVREYSSLPASPLEKQKLGAEIEEVERDLVFWRTHVATLERILKNLDSERRKMNYGTLQETR